jgi:hypothetical protein
VLLKRAPLKKLSNSIAGWLSIIAGNTPVGDIILLRPEGILTTGGLTYYLDKDPVVHMQ